MVFNEDEMGLEMGGTGFSKALDKIKNRKKQKAKESVQENAQT
jgi:hypothetical protein